jgi:hypothetical protein
MESENTQHKTPALRRERGAERTLARLRKASSGPAAGTVSTRRTPRARVDTGERDPSGG